MVNERGETLHISGRTGKYLELTPGSLAMNVVDMARDGLVYELRNAVIKCITIKDRVEVNEVKVKIEGHHQYIRLTVEPLAKAEASGLMLVLFQDLPDPKKRIHTVLSKDGDTSEKDLLIAEMEKELRYTREHLQQNIEEMETSYEELKSTNEELQSTNEESNTAKEQMQALNEELMTVNMEFRAKTEELTEVNNDMVNLLNSSEVATILITNQLVIKRFTNRATKIVNLIQSDFSFAEHIPFLLLLLPDSHRRDFSKM